MLKLFEVSGFKNFLSPIRIDFSDVKNYQFNENCICNNLLQKLIVYGKNASGKSNLGLALFDIVSHMTTNNVIPGLYSFYLNSESNSNLLNSDMFLFSLLIKLITYTVKTAIKTWYMNVLFLMMICYLNTIMLRNRELYPDSKS